MVNYVEKSIRTALQEDLSDRGDVTSLSTVPSRKTGNAHIIAKEGGIIAGVEIVETVLHEVDPELKITANVTDGDRVASQQEVIKIDGSLRSILTGERTALNFLGRLSGIATLTSRFVELTKHTGVRILDTRKTTPGLRLLEKYAVKAGGGYNHRIGLFDMVLIKENHVTAAGGIRQAVENSRRYLKQHDLDLKIEVETRNIDEVRQAVEMGIDRIMLDNMNVDQIATAVALVNKRVELEISGGVNLQNIAEYAETGVDFISIGALTHSAKALDFSLLIL
ncbi:carboxylating nicotinate-nucleotide diphosphorylase [candidate division KSB1 bacterium]|nr:carboxylating nicotinate-nucleotide diphosphorylase [candidate division KSB1 bacterium]